MDQEAKNIIADHDKDKPRVAILAYYFLPDNAVGAVRPNNWAEWLRPRFHVSVITKSQKEDGSYAANCNVVRPRSLFLSLIERLDELLRRRRGAVHPKNRLGLRKRSGIFRYRFPCLHDFWFLSGLQALQKLRPDIVIATHSPYISLIIAAVYKIQHPKVRLILDFRDLWTGNPKNVGIAGGRVVEALLERWVVGKADACTTVSETLRSQIAVKYPNKSTFLVYNTAAEASEFGGCVTRKTAGSPLRIIYTGTFYQEYNCSQLFREIAAWEEAGICNPRNLVIQVAGRDTSVFRQHARSLHVEKYILDHGHLSRADAVRLQHSADVLLLCETKNAGEEGTLTGKVFEYLMTAKPILLIGPQTDSELARLVDLHGRRITLSELRAQVRGEATARSYRAVSYRGTANRQLLNVLNHIGLDA